MKFRHLIFAAAALAAALFSVPQSSYAAQALLCAPESASTASGPRRVTNPNTNVSYSLNAAGCAPIAIADIGYFQAQGYTFGPAFGSLVVDTGTIAGTGNVNLGNLPAGTYIREIIVENKTATSVSGGVGIGTTSGATDVVTALTCGASCLTFVADSALKLRTFSTSAQQTLYASAVTTWQGARAIITVVYGYF